MARKGVRYLSKKYEGEVTCYVITSDGEKFVVSERVYIEMANAIAKKTAGTQVSFRDIKGMLHVEQRHNIRMRQVPNMTSL